MMPRSSLAIFIAVSVLGLSPAAHAEDWLLGNPLELDHLSAPAGPSISFTPRVPGVFDLDDAHVTLTYRPVAPDLGSVGSRTTDGFAVGGAFSLQDVVVSARLVQSAGEFVSRDEVDASFAIGGTTTYGSYTELDRGGGASTRFALGADLATAPGLSVGAGIAYEDRGDLDAADDATGLVRFRLSF